MTAPLRFLLPFLVVLASCTPTGSGATACTDPAACEVGCLDWVASMETPTEPPPRHIAARCEYANFSGRTVTTWEGFGCWCDLPQEGRREFVHRANEACSNFGRGGTCLYRSEEFPGCDVEEPSSCEAVCEDLYQRKVVHAAETIELELRDSLCTVGACHCAYRNDEQCFLGNDVMSFSCDTPIPEMAKAILERP